MMVAAACGDDSGSVDGDNDPVNNEGNNDTNNDVNNDVNNDQNNDQNNDVNNDENNAPNNAPNNDGGDTCQLPQVDEVAGRVATERGYVQGARDGQVWSWKGIPFAAPPTGQRRWAAPEPAQCWDDVRNATEFGPRCVQIDVGNGNPGVTGSEDCLHLNIWSPVDKPDGKARPVLFYIHGGANIVGSASQVIIPRTESYTYSGRHLANRGDAIVVTTQYRLGSMGFLAHDALDDEQGTSGNYGLMDQIAALQWVQDNIEAFGGDPQRVLVFGESAGAINTCMMYASPLASGLFSSALMQSGLCGVQTEQEARDFGRQAVEATPCSDAGDTLQCLRDLDAEEVILAAPGGVGINADGTATGQSWGPSVDGFVLPDTPEALIAAGEHNDVPFVIGSNAEEMASQSLNRVTLESIEAYETFVRQILGPLADRALELYPAASDEEANDAFIQMSTDISFTCPARRIARVASNASDANVHRYFFSRRPETAQGNSRASHGIELLYVFGTMADIPRFTPADEDRALAETMMDHWLSLAATGAPNTESDPQWPVYDAQTDPYLDFDAPLAADENLRAEKCDFWDQL